MAGAVGRHGWDGEWFRRAYDYAGAPVGSAENEEGQIFIEPQGMCVMAGIGLDDGRAQRALASVRDRLATPHGIVLHQPAYTRYRLELGEISSYPPGYKENGAIFCHTNPWVMIAEARAGDGDAAFDYYLRINPSAREEIAGLHRCEPYVYAQMIAGPDAPAHGEAKNSWLTGTAAWNLVAITQWILGIRPEHDGPAGRSMPARGVAGLHRRATVPGRHLPDRGSEGGRCPRPGVVAPRRRRARGGHARPARTRGRDGRRRRRDRAGRAGRRARDANGDGRIPLGWLSAAGHAQPGAPPAQIGGSWFRLRARARRKQARPRVAGPRLERSSPKG